MKAKIKHTSYVMDFLDIDFSSDKISNDLQIEVDEILSRIEINSLFSWELIIKALYSNQTDILIFRKGKSNTDGKYKEIVVHIPIPTTQVVKWGVKKEQHIKTGINDKVLVYADNIQIDPTNYHSRESFIKDCLQKAIKKIFELGFTINKKKIKLDFPLESLADNSEA